MAAAALNTKKVEVDIWGEVMIHPKPHSKKEEHTYELGWSRERKFLTAAVGGGEEGGGGGFMRAISWILVEGESEGSRDGGRRLVKNEISGWERRE